MYSSEEVLRMLISVSKVCGIGDVCFRNFVACCSGYYRTVCVCLVCSANSICGVWTQLELVSVRVQRRTKQIVIRFESQLHKDFDLDLILARSTTPKRAVHPLKFIECKFSIANMISPCMSCIQVSG